MICLTHISQKYGKPTMIIISINETTKIIENCPKISQVDDDCLQKLKRKVEEAEEKRMVEIKKRKILEILKMRGLIAENQQTYKKSHLEEALGSKLKQNGKEELEKMLILTVEMRLECT